MGEIGIDQAELILDTGIDELAWFEIEHKGCLSAFVQWGQREIPIQFHDPSRLAQEIASTLEAGAYWSDGFEVVVPVLSEKRIRSAFESLRSRGELARLLGEVNP